MLTCPGGFGGGYNAGMSIGEGLSAGIYAMAGSVASAAASIADAAVVQHDLFCGLTHHQKSLETNRTRYSRRDGSRYF